jgi:hypothetical protein
MHLLLSCRQETIIKLSGQIMQKAGKLKTSENSAKPQVDHTCKVNEACHWP